MLIFLRCWIEGDSENDKVEKDFLPDKAQKFCIGFGETPILIRLTGPEI